MPHQYKSLITALICCCVLTYCTPKPTTPKTIFSVDMEEYSLGGRPFGNGSLSGIEHSVKLRRFACRHCSLHEISAIRSLTQLQELDLTGNPIKDFRPLRELTNLKTLHLDRTLLSNLEDLPLESLQVLNANATQVANVSGLIRATYLKKLSLAQTPLRSITGICDAPALTILSMHGTPVRSVRPLSCARALEGLLISAPVSDLEQLPPSVTYIGFVLNAHPIPSLEKFKSNRPKAVIEKMHDYPEF